MSAKRKAEHYEPHIIQKGVYIRSRKLLDSSRGQTCTFGFQGCNYDTETTVACHANYDFTGKGTGIKSSDLYSADGCSHCHDVYDGRKTSSYTDSEKQEYFWRAFVKTTNRRVADGIIKVET